MIAAGYTDNQGSWPHANWQYVIYFFSQNGNIKYTINEVRQYSADLPQGGLEVPCTLCFSDDAKLGRF